MKKIEAIKKKMDKLNKEKPGTVEVNPPVSMDKVKEFEEKYKITLPKEYVEFITLVGDGGKVQPSPERSAVEITALGGYEESGYPLEGISLQFPLKKGWMPDFGDQIEGAEDVDDEDTLEEMTGDHWHRIETQGNIIVMTDSESSWRLIVNGERKGEVWQLSEYGIQRLIKCSFLRLLELYLSGELDDFTIECRDRECPGEKDPVKDCRGIMKKLRIKMNPPIDRTEIQEFEKRHNILLPEEYVTFLTEIGNGVNKSSSSIKEIYTLSQLDSLDNLDQPFLIQTEEDYKRIYFDENGDLRRFNWKGELLYAYQERGSIWEFLYPKKEYEKIEAKSPWMLPQLELLHGCIPIIGREYYVSAHGRFEIARQYLLVLNGAYKGQIWWANETDLCHVTNFYHVTDLCNVDGISKAVPFDALSIIGAIAYGGR